LKEHMTPTTMQALVFEVTGKAEEVLTVKTVPVPKLEAGEVLVKLEASPLHPADLMFIGGRYRIKPIFPQVAGLEGSGSVVDTGDGVSLSIGTHVAFRHPGTWAEYVSVPVAKLHQVPQGVVTNSACQFSLNPLTAWALVDEAQLKTGDWLAINAASSGVARLVCGLAKRKGVNVLGIVRGAVKSPLPCPVVSMESEDLAAAILKETGGKNIAALLDCVGGLSITRVFPAMQQGATIVSYGVMETTPAQVGNVDMIYRNLTWKGFGIDFWLTRSGERLAAVTADIWQAIKDGQLDLSVKASYPLQDFKTALEMMSAWPNTGKVLLKA
jgi:NADPH:quinone reductase